MANLSPEARRISEARMAAVAELKAIDGVERLHTDPAVIRLSNARLYEAAITMRVLKGERIPASEIKASDDLILAARNSVPKQINVDLHIMELSNWQTCPACQHRFEAARVRHTLEESQRAARERMATEKAMADEKKAIPTRAPGTTDLVRGAGSINDRGKMHGPTKKEAVPIVDPDKRAADLRREARISNGVDPGPPRPPAPNYATGLFGDGGDTRSVSQFMRDVNSAYNDRGRGF